MKTPIQELLDYTTNLLHTFDSEERVAMAVLDYLKTNKKALLEKEKEVMYDAWLIAISNFRNDTFFEEYYNETFNNEEK